MSKGVYDRRERKIITRYSIAAVIVLFSIMLIIASFIIPPTGVIDNSVLTALGEFLAFAGSCLGFSTSYEKKKLELEKNYGELSEKGVRDDR